MISDNAGSGRPQNTPIVTSASGVKTPTAKTHVGAVGGFAAGDHDVRFHGFATESHTWKARTLAISAVPAICGQATTSAAPARAAAAESCSAPESRKIPA